MPLTLMDIGVETTVKTIRGKDQTRKFLQNLGFVEGAKVTVVSSLAGNVIVNVKDALRRNLRADGFAHYGLIAKGANANEQSETHAGRRHRNRPQD